MGIKVLYLSNIHKTLSYSFVVPKTHKTNNSRFKIIGY